MSSLKPLQILETVSDAGKEGLGITDISKKTSLSKSTVHRLLTTLLSEGYVMQVPQSKKYILGNRMLKMVLSFSDQLDLRKVARPHLEKLSEKIRETVHLVQLDGLHGVYIDKIDSLESVGVRSSVGKKVMLHCTGSGKILFAHMSKEMREQVYKKVGLIQYTEYTITDRLKMEEELCSIRKNGYSVDRLEKDEGVCCIAAPIHNTEGQVIAACSISGPKFRFSVENAEALKDEVIEVGKLISEDLRLFFIN